MLTEQFSQVFREEHRRVRDGLLDLIDAFRDRDHIRIQSLLGQVAADTGPHFRYEEESLYPALVSIFGGEYIDQLFEDHDRAIGVAGQLVDLAGQAELTDADVERAVRLIRLLLPHVSDCDGLSIMVERLPDEQVQSIFDARERSWDEGLDLLKWAEQVRGRPAITPE